MDRFAVAAKSSSVLDESHLVEEMAYQAKDYDSFPVIINGIVRTFHEVRGGFSGGMHIVQLVQKHDSIGTNPSDVEAGVYEAHLDDSWRIYADDTYTFSDDEEFVLSILVADYDQEGRTFMKELQTDVDRRETEYTL